MFLLFYLLHHLLHYLLVLKSLVIHALQHLGENKRSPTLELIFIIIELSLLFSVFEAYLMSISYVFNS